MPSNVSRGRIENKIRDAQAIRSDWVRVRVVDLNSVLRESDRRRDLVRDLWNLPIGIREVEMRERVEYECGYDPLLVGRG